MIQPDFAEVQDLPADQRQEAMPQPDVGSDEPDSPTSDSDAPESMPPTPRPRRSLRTRKKPAWMTSGDYVCHIAHKEPDKRDKMQMFMTLQSQFQKQQIQQEQLLNVLHSILELDIHH